MAKDPAVLLYFDKWITATNGMRADFRAWYMDLMIYQYDKGSIPNDEDMIAGICRVRPSEYDLFKQMLEQVLKQKFKLNDNNCYENDMVCEVLRKREQFLDKRKKSGTIGSIIKAAKGINGFTTKHLDRLKSELYNMDIDELNKHMDKQVLKHLLKLYINVDVNEDVDIIIDNNNKAEKTKKITTPTLDEVRAYFQENGYDGADRAFQYYASNDWKDSQGKPVKNWKQKMIAVWFKDEKKISEAPKRKHLVI